MIFISNAEGVVTLVGASQLNQGSNKVNEIIFVGPFPATNAVAITVELPNGQYLFPDVASPIADPSLALTPLEHFSGLLKDASGNDLNAWSATLQAPITSYSGDLTISFIVVDNEGGRLATASTVMRVSRGVVNNLPSLAPTQANWTVILNAIAAAQTAEANAKTAEVNAQTAEANAETAKDRVLDAKDTVITIAERVSELKNEASAEAASARGYSQDALSQANRAQSAATNASASATAASNSASEASAAEARVNAAEERINEIESDLYNLQSEIVATKNETSGYAAAAASSASNAALSASNAEASKNTAQSWANSAAGSASQASNNASTALAARLDALTFAKQSEGYALGTQDGIPVSAGNKYYHNNAQYYSDIASHGIGLIPTASLSIANIGVNSIVEAMATAAGYSASLPVSNFNRPPAVDDVFTGVGETTTDKTVFHFTATVTGVANSIATFKFIDFLPIYETLIPMWTMEPQGQRIDDIINAISSPSGYTTTFQTEHFNRYPVIGDIVTGAGRTPVDKVVFHYTAEVIAIDEYDDAVLKFKEALAVYEDLIPLYTMEPNTTISQLLTSTYSDSFAAQYFNRTPVVGDIFAGAGLTVKDKGVFHYTARVTEVSDRVYNGVYQTVATFEAIEIVAVVTPLGLIRPINLPGTSSQLQIGYANSLVETFFNRPALIGDTFGSCGITSDGKGYVYTAVITDDKQYSNGRYFYPFSITELKYIESGTTVVVDQTYDATSTNAQSGTAVAQALSASIGDINTALTSIIAAQNAIIGEVTTT